MPSTRLSLAIPLVALFAGCGGRTIDPVGETPDAATAHDGSLVSPRPTGSAEAGSGTSTSTVEGCVDVELTNADVVCDADSDCTGANTGTICEDTCPCGGTAVNNAGASRVAAQTKGLEQGVCECPAFGVPTCLEHVCVLCGGLDQPEGCALVDCALSGTACDGGLPDADLPDDGFDAPLG